MYPLSYPLSYFLSYPSATELKTQFNHKVGT